MSTIMSLADQKRPYSIFPSYASTMRPTIGWRTTSAAAKRLTAMPSTPSRTAGNQALLLRQ